MPKPRREPSRVLPVDSGHREAAGLFRRQLADKVCCSAGYIGQLERGDKHVGYDMAYCLAQALGVTAPEDFYSMPAAPDRKDGE